MQRICVFAGSKLLSFLQRASGERFIRVTHLNILLQDTQPGQLLERFEIYAPDISSPWLGLPER